MFKSIITAIVIAAAMATPTVAAKKYNEAWFCDIVAEDLNGRSEVKTQFNKRIDIITSTHAIECDWLHKWAEGIGQALTYGELESKTPGLVVFIDVNKKLNKNSLGVINHMASVYNIKLWIYNINKENGEISVWIN